MGTGTGNAGCRIPAKARSKYVEDVQFFQVIQYWFYSQWDKLKTYCNNNGISLIGDMPIYVSYDSVEVWSQPELFELDRQHRPIAVAGCPPDVFFSNRSALGQSAL